jgi:hypothetical protein
LGHSEYFQEGVYGDWGANYIEHEPEGENCSFSREVDLIAPGTLVTVARKCSVLDDQTDCNNNQVKYRKRYVYVIHCLGFNDRLVGYFQAGFEILQRKNPLLD